MSNGTNQGLLLTGNQSQWNMQISAQWGARLVQHCRGKAELEKDVHRVVLIGKSGILEYQSWEGL